MCQWHDVTFCLSLLLAKSERSMKKIIDGLPFYCDKLHKEGVYAHFQEIFVKVNAHHLPSTHVSVFFFNMKHKGMLK